MYVVFFSKEYDYRKPVRERAALFFFFFFFFFFDDDDDDFDDERATSHRSGQVRGRAERAESGREEGTTWCLRCLDLRFRILLCVRDLERERSRIVIVVYVVVFVSSDGLLRVFFVVSFSLSIVVYVVVEPLVLF